MLDRLHGVKAVVGSSDKQYQAVGYSMIASRNGENSAEALAALAEAIDNAEPLRLDLVGAED